jgi:NTE family protein
MLSNFPVDIFDRSDGQPPRSPTFGIKLSSRPGALGESFAKDVASPVELTMAMIGALTSFRDSMYIDRPDMQARTIFVDTFGVKATDLDLDEATQNNCTNPASRRPPNSSTHGTSITTKQPIG